MNALEVLLMIDRFVRFLAIYWWLWLILTAIGYVATIYYVKQMEHILVAIRNNIKKPNDDNAREQVLQIAEKMPQLEFARCKMIACALITLTSMIFAVESIVFIMVKYKQQTP